MTGKEIYDRFCQELNRKGVTRKQFCEETGINQSALSNWGRRGTMPSSELVMIISEYLGCSTDYVLGKSDVFKKDSNDEPIFAPDEAELIAAWRSADEIEKRMLIEMIAFFKSKKQD